MSKKLTAQQEAFCQAYVNASGKRGAASNAYRSAYNTRAGADAVASAAKRLLRQSPIRLRIAELEADRLEEAHDLTPKQEAFCRQYMETGNASEAYRRAYAVSPDAKPGTIYGEASKLLANPKISHRLEELRAAVQRRYEVSIERATGELAKIAYANMDDYVEYLPDGTARLDLAKVTRTQMAAVKKLTFETVLSNAAEAQAAAGAETKDGEKPPKVAVVKCQFELHDKKGPIDSIMKHLGGFKEDNRQRGEAAGAAMAKELSDIEFARWLAFKLSAGAQPPAQFGGASGK
jgi:phage terminase small subunit